MAASPGHRPVSLFFRKKVFLFSALENETDALEQALQLPLGKL